MRDDRNILRRKKDSIKFAVLPVIAIVLESLPFGVALNFGLQLEDGSIGTIREMFSYFSMTPFGYGVFSPLITACLSCVLLLFIIIHIFTDRCKMLIAITAWITFIASLGFVMLGTSSITVSGVAISVILAAEAYFIGRALGL